MTDQELKQLIESKMESVKMRENAIEWATKNQGKAIRSNNLPEGFTRLRRQYGMTHIETQSYLDGNYDENSCSLLIEWAEKGVEVPTPEVLIERNPAYYRGVDERNESRRKLLKDILRMESIVRNINEAQEAIIKYRAACEELKKDIEYLPEQYDLEKIAGIIEEKR